MVRVFISYARPDADFAKSLIERLNATGIQTFDDSSVGLGGSFVELLRKAVSESDYVVALMSPEYFSSQWCQLELATAMADQKLVLPVRLRGRAEGPLSYLNSLEGDTGPREVADRIADAMSGEPG